MKDIEQSTELSQQQNESQSERVSVTDFEVGIDTEEIEKVVQIANESSRNSLNRRMRMRMEDVFTVLQIQFL